MLEFNEKKKTLSKEAADLLKEPIEIDTTLQYWVSKPYCVFARTTP